MDYFVFDGLTPADQVRFNDFIAANGEKFTSQADFAFDGQEFGFHIHQPCAGAFKANSDGTITLVRKAGQPNLRVRISPTWQNPRSQRWRYLYLDEPYKFEFDFQLLERSDRFLGVDWANLFEIWGPFDGADSGRNPAFEFMLRGARGVFDVRQRGDSRRVHDRNYEFDTTEHVPFRAGNHTLIVETQLSYQGAGYTKVTLDGEVVMDLKNVTNTYNSDPFGSGRAVGGLINFPEIYCGHGSVADHAIVMNVHRMVVSDGVESPDDDSSESSVSSGSSESSVSSSSVSSGSSTSSQSSSQSEDIDRILEVVSAQGDQLIIDWAAFDQHFKDLVYRNAGR